MKTYYSISYTQDNGIRIENQLYTAEHVSSKLMELEASKAYDIKIDVCIKIS